MRGLSTPGNHPINPAQQRCNDLGAIDLVEDLVSREWIQVNRHIETRFAITIDDGLQCMQLAVQRVKIPREGVHTDPTGREAECGPADALSRQQTLLDAAR
jgi:hypothetical protein